MEKNNSNGFQYLVLINRVRIKELDTKRIVWNNLNQTEKDELEYRELLDSKLPEQIGIKEIIEYMKHYIMPKDFESAIRVEALHKKYDLVL